MRYPLFPTDSSALSAVSDWFSGSRALHHRLWPDLNALNTHKHQCIPPGFSGEYTCRQKHKTSILCYGELGCTPLSLPKQFLHLESSWIRLNFKSSRICPFSNASIGLEEVEPPWIDCWIVYFRSIRSHCQSLKTIGRHWLQNFTTWSAWHLELAILEILKFKRC